MLTVVSPSCNLLEAASKSLIESSKLRQLLTLILAFGNYMNSQRRGGAYGFKLSVFARLLETRSRDRSVTLLNYIVEAATERYPECLKFLADIRGYDRASKLSLASLEQDLLSLERTANAVSKELAQDGTHPALLRFRDTVLPQIDQARDDFNRGKGMFGQATAYFAEEATMEPFVFFSLFGRLADGITQAQEQNQRRAEAKRKAAAELELKAAEEFARTEAMLQGGQLSSVPATPVRQAGSQGRLMRHASSSVDMKDEVADGDIDSLISGLKEQGFRRKGGGRQSKRPASKRVIGNHDHFEAYGAARPWLK
jgi:hypothetical protein